MAPAIELPDWLFVFVSPHNAMAVMNLQITGRYTSPVVAAMSDANFERAYKDGSGDFLPFVPNTHVSTYFMSPFTAGTISSYRVEYDAELTRRAYFKDAPSRLTGIYAFDSMETCRAVSARWPGWSLSTVQRFKPENVLRWTRVNMEIVSLARHAYTRAMLDAQEVERLWRSYWSSEDDYTMDLPSVDAKQREVISAGTTWEWIIDGTLVHESRA